MPNSISIDTLFLQSKSTEEVHRVQISDIEIPSDIHARNITIHGVLVGSQEKVSFTIGKIELAENMVEFNDVFDTDKEPSASDISTKKILSFRGKTLSILIISKTHRELGSIKIGKK